MANKPVGRRKKIVKPSVPTRKKSGMRVVFYKHSTPEFRRIFLETFYKAQKMPEVLGARVKDIEETAKLPREYIKLFGPPNTAGKMICEMIALKYVMHNTKINNPATIKRAIEIEDAIDEDRDTWIRGPSESYLKLRKELEKLVGEETARSLSTYLRHAREDFARVKLE
ncbi:MAG TPA: hypothetical protein VJH23_05585 [archaeon]|nr:hypothetical protein [archaeon]